MDYISGEEEYISQILDEHPFNFVLGSIHYIGNNFITTKTGFENFLVGRNGLKAIIDYFNLWKKAVDSGLFDIMTHPDFFRRVLYKMGIINFPFQEYEDVAFEAIDHLK